CRDDEIAKCRVCNGGMMLLQGISKKTCTATQEQYTCQTRKLLIFINKK
ncbi:MAG: hypothetical protein ACI9RP_002724, partial [Cyclobacteriaceae bacterium]